MGLIVPVIFLSVAAFLLNVVMTRLISTQREQIAALKAFGYSKLEVGFHYLQFVLLIALVGSILGAVGGVWLANEMTEMYSKFYKFPAFVFGVNSSILVIGGLVASGAAILGTLAAVARAVQSAARRGDATEPPANFRPTTDRTPRTCRNSSRSPARMVLRELERRPLKASCCRSSASRWLSRCW